MKTKLSKIIILAILILFFGITSSFAAVSDSFRVQCKEGLDVAPGEVVEVPIILDSIEIDKVQQGIVAISFKVEYDEDVFELINYENEFADRQNAEESFIQISIPYASVDRYNINNDAKKIVLILKNDQRIHELTEIGKIKLRAKEGIPSGKYDVSIIDISGGNSETETDIFASTTSIYVVGEDEEGQQEEQEIVISDEGIILGGTEELTVSEDKEVVAKIQQNKKGTSLKIIIDGENGIKVSKILIEDTEMTLQDGVFTAVVEPNTTYILKFYDEEGNYNTMKAVTVTNLEEETPAEAAPMPEDDEEEQKTDDKKDEENKDNEDNKDNKDDKDNKDEEPKTDDKKDETGKNTDDKKEDRSKTDNSGKQNVDKSAQTSDDLIVVASILITAVLSFAIISIITLKRFK